MTTETDTTKYNVLIRPRYDLDNDKAFLEIKLNDAAQKLLKTFSVADTEVKDAVSMFSYKRYKIKRVISEGQDSMVRVFFNKELVDNGVVTIETEEPDIFNAEIWSTAFNTVVDRMLQVFLEKDYSITVKVTEGAE